MSSKLLDYSHDDNFSHMPDPAAYITKKDPNIITCPGPVALSANATNSERLCDSQDRGRLFYN